MLRDAEHAVRIRCATKAEKELAPVLKEAARDSPCANAVEEVFCSSIGSSTSLSKDILPDTESREEISVTLSR